MSRPFKLQAVLNHRRHREDTARRHFAEAAHRLDRAQRALAQQEKIRSEYRRAMRQKQDDSGSAMEILMYTRYLGRLDSEIRAQRKIVTDLVRDKEKLRRELMTSLKDRKIMEKLEERHRADEEKKARDLEQKMLSDVAISRYQRRA